MLKNFGVVKEPQDRRKKRKKKKKKQTNKQKASEKNSNLTCLRPSNNLA